MFAVYRRRKVAKAALTQLAPFFTDTRQFTSAYMTTLAQDTFMLGFISIFVIRVAQAMKVKSLQETLVVTFTVVDAIFSEGIVDHVRLRGLLQGSRAQDSGFTAGFEAGNKILAAAYGHLPESAPDMRAAIEAAKKAANSGMPGAHDLKASALNFLSVSLFYGRIGEKYPPKLGDMFSARN